MTELLGIIVRGLVLAGGIALLVTVMVAPWAIGVQYIFIQLTN